MDQQSRHLSFHLCLPLLGDESLANAKGDARFVHGLVGCYGHVDLVSHAKQEQPPLCTIDGDLSNELIFTHSGRLREESIIGNPSGDYE